MKKVKPPFRVDLQEAITRCDTLPFEHRGTITDTLYEWTEVQPTLYVDRRDLIGLLRDAGDGDFDGEWIREMIRRKKKRMADFA